MNTVKTRTIQVENKDSLEELKTQLGPSRIHNLEDDIDTQLRLEAVKLAVSMHDAICGAADSTPPSMARVLDNADAILAFITGEDE